MDDKVHDFVIHFQKFFNWLNIPYPCYFFNVTFDYSILKEFIRKLTQAGCQLKRHRKKHDSFIAQIFHEGCALLHIIELDLNNIAGFFHLTIILICNSINISHAIFLWKAFQNSYSVPVWLSNFGYFVPKCLPPIPIYISWSLIGGKTSPSLTH